HTRESLRTSSRLRVGQRRGRRQQGPDEAGQVGQRRVRGGERRGLQERRRRGSEVEAVEQVRCVGVPVGERRQVPLRLDQLQDRGVVVDRVRDVVGLCPRRGDHRRYPEPVPVVAAREVRRDVDGRRNRVGGYGGRRADVVVVAAALVVGEDEHGPGPGGPGQDRVDDGCRVGGAERDVLRALLRCL